MTSFIKDPLYKRYFHFSKEQSLFVTSDYDGLIKIVSIWLYPFDCIHFGYDHSVGYTQIKIVPKDHVVLFKSNHNIVNSSSLLSFYQEARESIYMRPS